MISFILFLESKNFNKELLDQFGKYKFYLIDADRFRSSSHDNEEFGDYAIPQWFKSIPKNEVWIDNDTKLSERKFFITNALTQLKILDNGGSEHKAYDLGIKTEKSHRKKDDKVKNKPPKDEIYVKKYCKIEDMTVWLVNGEVIRDFFKVDFVEGGNGGTDGSKTNGAYAAWMPQNEIWIESTTSPKEIPLVILHEFVENTVMKLKHYTYDKAHNIASKVEFDHRPDGFTKQDVENLTREKALKMANKFN